MTHDTKDVGVSRSHYEKGSSFICNFILKVLLTPKFEENCKTIDANQIVFKNGGEINFISINSTNSLRGRELDGIIVDCSSVISQKKIDQLYQDGYPCMINKKYKFFIFVE